MPASQPRRSPEVEAIFIRVLRSFADGDVATVSRLTNPGPEFRAIGTDPDEWWSGDDFLPIMAAQMAEMEGVEIEIRHTEAWEMGSVAWAAGRVMTALGGSEVEMRITGVFVLDEGMWRIVQWHSSEGVANEESLGFSLTTTLTEILDSLDLDEDMRTLPSEGMLTLMFTDVEDSTRHAAELGDRRYTHLMAEHIALVGRHADLHGGQVIKTVGDGALLAFSSVRAGVACAVSIQRETASLDLPYAIRIGLHAGDVVRTDSDVMGFAVNKAARVTSAADGGQIVTSSVVRDLVGDGDGHRFGTPFLAELKGIDGIHELVPVEWADERVRTVGG